MAGTAGGSGGGGRAGASVAAGHVVQNGRMVTTPSGPHGVYQTPHATPSFTPLRGTQERGRKSTQQYTNIRAGGPTVSPVATAQFRQQRPLNARTYGMAPVVHVRRTPSVR